MAFKVIDKNLTAKNLSSCLQASGARNSSDELPTRNPLLARSFLACLALMLVLVAYVGSEGAYAAPDQAQAPSAAAGKAAASTQATVLTYTIDARLLYLDQLARPASPSAVTGTLNKTQWSLQDSSPEDNPSDEAAREPKAVNRTLGLRRLRIAFDWQTTRATNLHLVLRPDAVNREQENRGKGGTMPDLIRDVDTRAGTPYRAAPTIRLLDAYHLTLSPASSFRASFGVWEALEASASVYPELLGFGLSVRMPAKFSALRLRWEDFREAPPTSAGVTPPVLGPAGLFVDAYLLQGNEDRSEALGLPDRGVYDQAPVASNPYYGGATQVSWILSSTFALGMTGVYVDGADDASGGRRNEVLAQLTGSFASDLWQRSWRLGLDTRYGIERWSGVSIPDRTQQSIALTSAWQVSRLTWWLFGFSHGRSERPVSSTQLGEKVLASGYAVETGFLRDLGHGLSLQLQVSQERREHKEQARTIGGFVDADGDHKIARRLGLELVYSLSDDVI